MAKTRYIVTGHRTPTDRLPHEPADAEIIEVGCRDLSEVARAKCWILDATVKPLDGRYKMPEPQP